MSADILAAAAWPTNAELIRDVAALGYIPGHVCDVTYGLGNWWTIYRPERLTAHDLNPDKSPIGYPVDFTATGHPTGEFDTVAFDPPYKLNGTATDEVDARYGVDEWRGWKGRHRLIREGLTECARIARRFVLLKCQDQVNSGHVRWQTYEFVAHAATVGLRPVDSFLMLGHRAQPEGRSQVHARRNYSTLIVFEKVAPAGQVTLL